MCFIQQNACRSSSHQSAAEHFIDQSELCADGQQKLQNTRMCKVQTWNLSVALCVSDLHDTLAVAEVAALSACKT